MVGMGELTAPGAPAVDVDPLLARCRAGDTRAFDEIVRLYGPRIHTLCLRLLGDADAAFDAAQETFIRAYDRLPRFRGDAALATWLYRIAVNTSLAMARQRRRHPEVGLPASLPRAEGGWDRVVEEQATLQLLDRLHPTYRLVLVLRYFEELDCEEIARVMERSVSQVWVTLKRARDAYRKLCEEQEQAAD
jgi:RNA polymerase sigma-70 factor (ECF subfamily)